MVCGAVSSIVILLHLHRLKVLVLLRCSHFLLFQLLILVVELPVFGLEGHETVLEGVELALEVSCLDLLLVELLIFLINCLRPL